MMEQLEDSVVVFGGGGIWGVAWMTGFIHGLAERGIDVRRARGFIGTSAGSVLSSQVAHGFSLADLFERQIDPDKQPRERLPQKNGLAMLMALMGRTWESPEARRRAVADFALNKETIEISVAERRADIVERLGVPSGEWPARSLSITAVDIASCALCVFTAQSGVNLIDAVAASCAVPGVWPPTPIKDHLYMDGGVWRNADNAHLAQGERHVLIVSPFGAHGPATPGSLHADMEDLRKSGSNVELIGANKEALVSLGSSSPLDPSIRRAAALAGHAQAKRLT